MLQGLLHWPGLGGQQKLPLGSTKSEFCQQDQVGTIQKESKGAEDGWGEAGGGAQGGGPGSTLCYMRTMPLFGNVGLAA